VPSRVKDIRALVDVHIAASISGVTITHEPVALDSIPKDQFPHAIALYQEATPERLGFRQERRVVTGQIVLGYLTAGADPEDVRETCDLALQTIRDAIFADDTLSASVDYITADSAVVFSQADDEKVYGTLEIVTEEVF
jgi:hypothetical protein